MRTASYALEPEVDLVQNMQETGFEPQRPVLVQLFMPEHEEKSLCKTFETISASYPEAIVIGLTTQGSLAHGNLQEEKTVASVMQFETAKLRVSHAALKDPSHSEASQLTGETLAKQVVDNDTKLVLCYATGDCLNAENLAKGITLKNPRITLSGGIASGIEKNWLFAQGQYVENGAIAISINGEKIWPETFHSNDWMMLGTSLTITEAMRNQVTTINNQPARDVYQRYLGEETKKKLNGNCSRFPLLMTRGDKIFARPCNSSQEREPVQFWGNLEQGEVVRFGIPDPVTAMDAFHRYTRQIQRNGSQALFMYPSVARKLLMKSLTEDEVRQLESLAPTSGCFCHSQFHYHPDHPDYLHYAQTVLSIREGEEESFDGIDPDTLEEFSAGTMQLRAVSKLLGSTTRELEENNRLLEELASTDPLTRTLNRYKMQQLLENEFRRVQRYGRPWSLIMFDLDQFKAVNDTHGHQVGDQVLQTTAEIVRESVRDTDAIARWGGEEFLILCPETNTEGTTEIAERICQNLEVSEFPNDLKITASIGVTSYQSEDTLDSLLNRVDQALYHSKKNGRNQITVWK